jgi:hypothetical protein
LLSCRAATVQTDIYRVSTIKLHTLNVNKIWWL